MPNRLRILLASSLPILGGSCRISTTAGLRTSGGEYLGANSSSQRLPLSQVAAWGMNLPLSFCHCSERFCFSSAWSIVVSNVWSGLRDFQALTACCLLTFLGYSFQKVSKSTNTT